MALPETVLFDAEICSSLDTLVETYGRAEFIGAEIEIWVFDGRSRREAARETLKQAGVSASVRSAYKPLVHALIEEIDLDGTDDILICYPVVEGLAPNRFLLEAYPANEHIGGDRIRFEPADPEDGSRLLNYQVSYRNSDGCQQTIKIAAPGCFRQDHVDCRVFASSGWVRVRLPHSKTYARDEAFHADQAQAFDRVMAILVAQEWSVQEPHFDRLDMCIEAPFYDQPLAFANECISTAEAMHEDLYFSALEVFKKKRGLPLDDRTIMPGQLVPQITSGNGPLRVRVSVTQDPGTRDPGLDMSRPAEEPAGLDRIDHWLKPGRIKAELDALGGVRFEARSQRGRPVWGTFIDNPGPGLVITAGQHANETSGPIGALRAAKQLATERKIGFAVAPLVNPDGYAVFRELCATYPHHMNHAARFTASGCDLEYVGRGYENEAHYTAREMTRANLHLNLHGYPAHEWTRPFSGYVPRGAEIWTIPKGFFLILRYRPGWRKQGEAVLNAMIDALADYPPIIDLNREQMQRSRRYDSISAFEVRSHVPYFLEERDDPLFPMTIITEAPDETIYGEEFVICHTAQMKAVLAAAEANRRIADLV